MQRKIRIMQLTANLGIGGLERVVANLCKNLDKDIFDVSVCCLKFTGEFAKELRDAGIPVHLVQQVGKNPDYTLFWRLREVLRREAPDLVHTHNINSFFDGAVASFLARVPALVNTDHARNFPGRLRERLLEAVCAKRADRFIAVSEETKSNLVRYERISPSKIEIVRNGINGQDYDIKVDVRKKKEELGLSGFEHVIGLGVRLTSQKGVAHLIEAAPLILEQFPETALLIAGKGSLGDSLQELAAKRGVSENVRFIGPRLDLPEILQVLDVYVLPSEWEGLPLVLLEAMAAGRAIVATRVGGNSAVIEHGTSGLLIAPRDPRALAEAVCGLLSSAEQRSILGKNARERFYREFSVERMAYDYEQVYKKILRTKGILKQPSRVTTYQTE